MDCALDLMDLDTKVIYFFYIRPKPPMGLRVVHSRIELEHCGLWQQHQNKIIITLYLKT